MFLSLEILSASVCVQSVLERGTVKCVSPEISPSQSTMEGDCCVCIMWEGLAAEKVINTPLPDAHNKLGKYFYNNDLKTNSFYISLAEIAVWQCHKRCCHYIVCPPECTIIEVYFSIRKYLAQLSKIFH